MFTGSFVTDLAALIVVILVVSFVLTALRGGRDNRIPQGQIDRQGYRRN